MKSSMSLAPCIWTQIISFQSQPIFGCFLPRAAHSRGRCMSIPCAGYLSWFAPGCTWKPILCPLRQVGYGSPTA